MTDVRSSWKIFCYDDNVKIGKEPSNDNIIRKAFANATNMPFGQVTICQQLNHNHHCPAKTIIFIKNNYLIDNKIATAIVTVGAVASWHPIMSWGMLLELVTPYIAASLKVCLQIYFFLSCCTWTNRWGWEEMKGEQRSRLE